MSYDIALKRIYSPVANDDGFRILTDRLWPRGKARDSLALDEWYVEASPSPLLRRQLHQGAISRKVFEIRYRGELRDNPKCLIPLMRYARRDRLTLLSASRDLEDSYLAVLRDRLVDALREEDLEDAKPASPPCFATGSHWKGD